MYRSGQLLGALGGGAGAGALGQSGREGGGLFDLLDYPRQAIYNVGRSAGKLFGGGDFGVDDAISALPGVLGGALALGSFGTAMPLAGLLTAGAGQALGKLTGRPEFDAAKPSALVEALGGDPESMWQNMAAGIATDPLTYAGLGGGARIGANTAERVAAGGGFKPLAKGLLQGESGAADINKLIGLEGEPSLAEALLGRPLRSEAGLPPPLSKMSYEDLLRSEPTGLPGRSIVPRQTMDPAELEALLAKLVPEDSFEPSHFRSLYGNYLPEGGMLSGGMGQIGDFEHELLAGELGRMPPAEMMRTRLNLWDDYLRNTGKTTNQRFAGAPLDLGPQDLKMLAIRHRQAVGEANIAPLLRGDPEELVDLARQSINQASYGTMSEPVNPHAVRPLSPQNLIDLHAAIAPGESRGLRYDRALRTGQMADELYARPFRDFLGGMETGGNIAPFTNPAEWLYQLGYPLDPSKVHEEVGKRLLAGGTPGMLDRARGMERLMQQSLHAR